MKPFYIKKCIVPAIAAVLTHFVILGRAASVTFEAESGVLGSDWAVSNSTSPAYITTTVNNIGYNPGSSALVATYSVTFPESGTYDLYARVRVGPNTFNDDSMFYASSFGIKSPTTNSDWVLVNGLGGVGFDVDTNVVTGGGSLGSGVWKWINLSEFTSQPGFTVSSGNLTQTFQIGSREDGLDIDKFVFGTAGYWFTVSNLDTGTDGTPAVPPPPPPPPQIPPDLVAGNLIQFNDNGNWTWFSDERSIVDKAGEKIVVGSDANGAGMGGSERNGAIEAAVFDLQSRTSKRYTLLAAGILGPDDHNAPAFMLRPDGKYLAQWTGHNQNWDSYFSIFDGASWSPYTVFDWYTLTTNVNEKASYSNPYYLAAEGRAYTFVRSLDIRSMNILMSTDYGDTWTYYGKLNRSYPGSGYNPGYYKFCGNGKDRIDFICTESHPRDTLTSIYEGYISNSMSFKTDGTVVDTNLNDTNAPLSSDFMLVFSNGTVMPPGMTNYRCWDDDVQRYPDGTIECIISARINQSAHTGGYPDQENPDHAFFFCRWDGTKWTPTYLCQAGYKLYSAEADYVGLGCLSPNDPNTIFISTRYDPRAVAPGVFDTNQPYSAMHEIWKGVTTNHGASFTWTPITQNSTHENLRPIVPVWDSNDIALIWFRGTYNTAQIIDATPVGLVERHAEIDGQKTYVDANTTNTTLATGAALVTGSGTGQWHLRTTTGNDGNVLASADVVAEDAPTLKTTVSVPGPGTYDLWANFWGSPFAGEDWRIMAGIATNQMQTYREQGSEEVEASDYNSGIVVSNAVTNFLYQAYVGRVTASSSNTVSIFVDDNALKAGTTNTFVGDTNRTWYDGVSFAKVNPLQIQDFSATPSAITLVWNSTPPERSLMTPTYTIQKTSSLTPPISWTTVATGIPAATNANTTTYIDNTDNTTSGSAVFYRITRP